MFNIKPKSKMKKFLCCAMLMMITLIASASAQMKAFSPPEQDIGYEQVATLSLDGMTVVAFDSQWNIVDLQTPVMLNMEVSYPSAQVVDAYSVQTPMGEISMTLVCYRWPNVKNECTNIRSDYTYNVPHSRNAYSFTTAHTDNL